jgi:uncharacterized protein (DUF1501 family)
METPTMQPTRRDFLRLGLGTSTLLACGAAVPAFLARSASVLAAEPAGAAKGNVLVVLQLDGGNDGLNTVIPYKDDDYRKHRPKLQQPVQQLHKLDDRMALHSSLAGLAKLHEKGQLAVVQSVGYPNPNRSHFESMAIWHAARLKPKADTPGWLARCLDERPAAPGGDSPALHVSASLLPQALYGSQRQVPSLDNLEQFRRRLGLPEGPDAQQQRAALDQIGSQEQGEPGSLLQFVERSTLITYTSSARLEGVLNGQAGPTGYPEFYGLARRLKLIAQLIKAGLNTSIYYTRLGGFDTHASQQFTHANLLREMGDSLKAFLEDVNKTGEGKRVVVLVFSEFGRRLTENASGGTDHGTAAPVLLLGQGVRPGLHGPYPNLQDLDAGGDPKHAIDFRQVYAAVLERWLGCPSEKVLGGKFEHVPVFAKQPV